MQARAVLALPDAEFARILFAISLGEAPLSAKLEAGLLGAPSNGDGPSSGMRATARGYALLRFQYGSRSFFLLIFPAAVRPRSVTSSMRFGHL